jgi:sn-1 stearoyl-lipid 9-desaturase
MNLRYKPEHYAPVLWGGLVSLAVACGITLAGLTSWWWLLGTWLVYSFMAMTNSAGFHRLFAHRSYETTPFWEWFLLITGTLSCYGSSFQWAVVHSQHHKHSDTELDPHRFSKWWQMFTSNYVIEKVDFSAKRVIHRLLKKPGHKFVHNHYWALPTLFALALAALSPTVLVFCYLAPLGLVIFSAALFNYISHGEDGPNNAAFYALQASGEWRHRLHHEKPWLWDLREKWYHVDASAMFIRMIKKPEPAGDVPANRLPPLCFGLIGLILFGIAALSDYRNNNYDKASQALADGRCIARGGDKFIYGACYKLVEIK